MILQSFPIKLCRCITFPSACVGPRCRGGRRGRVSCRSWPVQMPESFPSTVSHRPFSLGRRSPSPYPNSNPPRRPEAPATAPTRIRRRPTWPRQVTPALRRELPPSSSLPPPSVGFLLALAALSGPRHRDRDANLANEGGEEHAKHARP